MMDERTCFQTWIEDSQFQQGVAAEKALIEAAWLLQDALVECGLTQEDLARKLGKSRSYVTQLLHGRKNLTLRSLVSALDALGCDLVLGLSSRKDLPATSPEPQAAAEESVQPSRKAS